MNGKQEQAEKFGRKMVGWVCVIWFVLALIWDTVSPSVWTRENVMVAGFVGLTLVMLSVWLAVNNDSRLPKGMYGPQCLGAFLAAWAVWKVVSGRVTGL